MYKFSLFLLLCLFVLLSGNLHAVEYVWDAGGDGYSWHDGLNWDLDAYPNYFSQNVFIAGPQYSSGLDANTTVAANNIYLSHADYGDGGTLTLEPNSVLNVNSYLYMGSESGGDNGVINIDGGTLNIGTSGNGLVKVYDNGHVFNLNSGTVNVNTSTSWAGYFRMGHVAMTPDSVTTINIHGGTLNAEGIKLGYYYKTGTHNLNMTGGTLNLAHLDLSDADYTTSHVQFDGGTINISVELWVNNNSDLNKNGTMDMTGFAKLVLNGDRVGRINYWINDGRLTASAGDTFDVSYDSVAGKTIVTVSGVCPYGDLVGDINGDCVVDLGDLYLLTNHWLEGGGPILASEPDDDNHLQAYYAFEDGAGNAVSDSSGNGFDAAVNFGAAGSWDTAGVDGGCINFNSSTEIDADADMFNTLDSEISFSMWVEIDANALDGSQDTSFAAYVLGSTDSVATAIQLGRQYSASGYDKASNTFLCGYDPAMSPAYDSATATPITPITDPVFTGWHHFGFTKNAVLGTVRIYIDGKLLVEDTGKSKPLDDIRDNAAVLNIGYYRTPTLGAGGHFNGKIDEFRVYDYELSQAEMIYLAGKTSLIQPLPNEAQAIDNELIADDSIDFMDFAGLAENWLQDILP
jgi:hypothetical protein